MPIENLRMAHDRLDDLVTQVRKCEFDLQLDEDGDLAGKATKQRKQFRRIADKLEGIADDIVSLDQSRQKIPERAGWRRCLPSGPMNLNAPWGKFYRLYSSQIFWRAMELTRRRRLNIPLNYGLLFGRKDPKRA